MSGKMSGLVFEHYPEGGGEMLTALCLADHADHDGTSIYPSVETVAKLTRQSRRTVQYHLSKMQESGWLLLVGNAKGGRQKAREYRINPVWIETGKLPEKGAKAAPFNPEAVGAAGAVDNSEKGAAAIAPFGSGKGATGDNKGCNPEHERVQSEAGKGATAIAPEPSVPVIDPSVTRGASAPPDHIRNATTGEINPRPVQLAILLRKTYGMEATSNSAEVHDMVRLAVTDTEIAEHVELFHLRKPGERPNARYVLRMIESTRKRAAEAAATGDPSCTGAAAAEAGIWWRSTGGINAKGAELSVKRRAGDPDWVYKVRVFKAAGSGKWQEELLADMLRTKNSMYAQVFEQFHGHPPIGEAA
ncbi:hypothetical protein N234_31720 [Ralstonia pickettii DTP0602]|nr:hypothetical protein N234_31720 [Ralstonia pickettii DTP0602]